MPQLGRWVLRTACAQAAEWSRAGFHVGVGVNISVQQAGDDLVHDVAEVLRQTGLSPDRLMLEVTESIFVADSEAAAGPLEAVRAAGVRIAIDDFGTGYSSLGYLRRFQVDILKIAREFIGSADGGTEDWAFARAMVALGQTLDLHVIAEGIEQPGQLEQLRQLGCEFGQGYYFARPGDGPSIAAAFLPPVTAGGRARRTGTARAAMTARPLDTPGDVVASLGGAPANRPSAAR